MATLDEILTAVCETLGLDESKLISREDDDETYRTAITAFCNLASVVYGYGYRFIGKRINRTRQCVYYQTRMAPSRGCLYEYTIRELGKKLGKDVSKLLPCKTSVK